MFQSLMQQRPLPGPCQTPTNISVVTAASTIGTLPPPPPPPPQFSAFDMGGMQVVSQSYADPLQFITGEAHAMSTGMTMPYDQATRMAQMPSQPPPQLPPQQPPNFPMEAFHLNGQCGGASPHTSMFST